MVVRAKTLQKSSFFAIFVALLALGVEKKQKCIALDLFVC